ncbi:MAG: LysE family translocator [Oceanospirillales bacterium]|nr:LysE family translocator [Oceanospirillales bacterium]
MDLVHGLLIITLVHTLAAASPGPDFVLVSQQTLKNGTRAGLLCSLGIALGLSVHIIYSAFGLAAIIANSQSYLWAIKLLGGSYLIYLGFKGLKAKKAELSSEVSDAMPMQSAGKSISTGFLCNVLNPKAPIYFVSLFTVVLSPDIPAYQIAIYGVWMMVIQMAWFSLVVGLFSRPSISQRFKQMGHWVDRVLGGAMMALGIKVIFTRVN